MRQADLFEEACRATLKPDEAAGLTLQPHPFAEQQS
jgi:hypothetical protein